MELLIIILSGVAAFLGTLYVLTDDSPYIPLAPEQEAKQDAVKNMGFADYVYSHSAMIAPEIDKLSHKDMRKYMWGLVKDVYDVEGIILNNPNIKPLFTIRKEYRKTFAN